VIESHETEVAPTEKVIRSSPARLLAARAPCRTDRPAGGVEMRVMIDNGRRTGSEPPVGPENMTRENLLRIALAMIGGLSLAGAGCRSGAHLCVQSASIMTFEEYVQGPLRPMPHIVVLSAGHGQLFCFGTRHTFDPADWQLRAIEDYWRQYHPTLALNEGGDPPVLPSRDETVSRFGEAGFVRYLAQADRTPVRSLEPLPGEEHALLLEDFSAEQIKLFYVLRGVAQFRKSRNDESVEDFVAKVLAGLSSAPGLAGAPASLPEFEQSYARLFSEPSDWRNVPAAWFDPAVSKPATYTNRVSRRLSEFRDRHMVNLLVGEVRKGERVFAVVGGSHVIMQERALRRALASAFGPRSESGPVTDRSGAEVVQGPASAGRGLGTRRRSDDQDATAGRCPVAENAQMPPSQTDH
jgi:hypothetical protein